MKQEDVSIIIPTFRRLEMLPKALDSAIASGAGEIIVIDNDSQDGTAEYVRSIPDPRVRLIEQPQNVGIWKNHRDGIAAATRPWIKFVHADDFLGDGGLARYCEAVDANTALVWANPTFFDHSTGEKKYYYKFDEPLRFSSTEYCKRLENTGWELGTPSHMMFRRESADLSDRVWENAQYSDVICGVKAARSGDVVLLPAGPINHGLHSDQISRTQGLEKHFERNFSTLDALLTDDDPWIRRYGALFGWAEVFAGMRSIVGWVRQNRRLPAWSAINWQMRCIRRLPLSILAGNLGAVFDMLSARYRPRPVTLSKD